MRTPRLRKIKLLAQTHITIYWLSQHSNLLSLSLVVFTLENNHTFVCHLSNVISADIQFLIIMCVLSLNYHVCHISKYIYIEISSI